MEDKNKKFGIISYPDTYDCGVMWYDSLEEAISAIEGYTSDDHILVMKVEVTKKYYINDNLIGEDNG